MIYRIKLTEEGTNAGLEEIHVEADDIFVAMHKALAYGKEAWGKVRVSKVEETDIVVID